MNTGALGKVYHDGEVIFQQGDVGDCMYVVQEGKVEIFQVKEGRESRLRVLSDGDFFGEMAIFEKERRSASVRALGDVRVLTVDKKTLLSRIHQDPTMAFRLLETMSRRIRELSGR